MPHERNHEAEAVAGEGCWRRPRLPAQIAIRAPTAAAATMCQRAAAGGATAIGWAANLVLSFSSSRCSILEEKPDNSSRSTRASLSSVIAPGTSWSVETDCVLLTTLAIWETPPEPCEWAVDDEGCWGEEGVPTPLPSRGAMIAVMLSAREQRARAVHGLSSEHKQTHVWQAAAASSSGK